MEYEIEQLSQVQVPPLEEYSPVNSRSLNVRQSRFRAKAYNRERSGAYRERGRREVFKDHAVTVF